jgi:hypothetical protein
LKHIVFIFFFLPLSLHAQIVRQPLSVPYASLGAYSKNFVDAFSGAGNQAALAQLRTASFGVYAERKFLLQELNHFSSVVALPTSSGTFALQGDYFGFSDYNENQLGLAFARSVSKQIDVGIRFNYHTVRIAGYGNASAINFEGGTIFHLTDKLHAGFHIYNPFSSKLGKTGNEALAFAYKAGLGYEPSDKVFISSEIIKQQDQPVNVNVGLQYNLHENVFLRAGISTYTSNSYAGAGLKFGIIRLDINAAYHPQLGFTPGVLLLVNLKKPTE